MRSIPQAAVELVRKAEGCKLIPYRCPAKIWTIGIGSTHDADGNRVTPNTPPINMATAEALLRRDLTFAANWVLRLCPAPLNENQFAALISFTQNLGSGNLQASTLRKKINRRDYQGAAEEFKKWVFGGGVKLPGLVIRRKNEAELFKSPTHPHLLQ